MSVEEVGGGEVSTEVESQEVDQPTPGEGEVSQEPSYEPNLKFKVKDKELEFDPRFHAIVKSKEDEDFLRDLHTKAYGLDEIKAAKEALAQEFEQNKGEWARQQQELRRLFSLREANLGEFLGKLQINDDQLIEYLEAKNNPEIRESPHFQKANQLSTEHFTLKNEYEDLRTSHQQNVFELHQIKMDLAMNRPDVQEFAKLYETRVPGQSFKELVRQTGDLIFKTQGKVADPRELVDQVISAYRPMFPANQVTTQDPHVQQPQAQVTPQQSAPKPPVNIGSGSNSAPVKRKFKSFDEVRRYASQLEG